MYTYIFCMYTYIYRERDRARAQTWIQFCVHCCLQDPVICVFASEDIADLDRS